MQKSVWSDSVSLPSFPALSGEHKTDVLIIGGGLCGILCAHFLQKAGVPYILVEGKTIAGGITQNTTAKITSLHGLIYAKLLKTVGAEKAKMYLDANEAAVGEYRQMCAGKDCGWEEKKAYTYSLSDRKKLEEEVSAAVRLGSPATYVEKPALPFSTKGAVCFPGQAQFHPLMFIAEIAKDLRIYENTFIYDIQGKTALFKGGKIRAENIVVTTHFPFINAHGSYFLKLYQHRSYVAAYENAPHIDGMYIDENEKGLSFRNYNSLLFIGGGGHRTGKNGTAWREISAFAKEHYPNAHLRYSWAAQDCMSLDGVPYIGRYSAKTPHLFVATGFQKWGMTSSMAAAKILCDMLCGKENPHAAVFSPQRSILKPQLFVNGFSSAANLLMPVKRRCPHLGCALHWNRAEHSWDCPCHGSRFTENGKLIDNPAMRDADITPPQ